MREKLIELIASTEYGNGLVGENFQEGFIAKIADHLIANGVTFATDNNVGDKMTPTNADRIRAWNDHELAETIAYFVSDIDNGDVRYSDDPNEWLRWLKHPAKEGADNG